MLEGFRRTPKMPLILSSGTYLLIRDKRVVFVRTSKISTRRFLRFISFLKCENQDKSLGTGHATKSAEFSGGGVIFDPKIYIADFGPL